ncbi:hypothetical protein NMG60_11032309 [Bertholletia excelsa]
MVVVWWWWMLETSDSGSSNGWWHVVVAMVIMVGEGDGGGGGGGGSGADLVDETCQKTAHPDLCNSTLRSNPNSTVADVAGLARIMFGAALSKAAATLTRVKILFHETKDPVLRESFDNCITQYDDTVAAITNAIKSVGSDNKAAKDDSYTAMMAPLRCENTLLHFPPHKSPLTDANNDVIRLVLVADDIVYTLGGWFPPGSLLCLPLNMK